MERVFKHKKMSGKRVKTIHGDGVIVGSEGECELLKRRFAVKLDEDNSWPFDGYAYFFKREFLDINNHPLLGEKDYDSRSSNRKIL